MLYWLVVTRLCNTCCRIVECSNVVSQRPWNRLQCQLVYQAAPSAVVYTYLSRFFKVSQAQNSYSCYMQRPLVSRILGNLSAKHQKCDPIQHMQYTQFQVKGQSSDPVQQSSPVIQSTIQSSDQRQLVHMPEVALDIQSDWRFVKFGNEAMCSPCTYQQQQAMVGQGGGRLSELSIASI